MSWISTSSPLLVPQRAETVYSSSRTERGTPIRSDRASSIPSIYESSPGFDEALIEAEVHVNEVPKVVSDSIEFLLFQ